VKRKYRTIHKRQQREIECRLANKGEVRDRPMFTARRTQYELSDRINATCHGGIGAIHEMVVATGLPQAIDKKIELLKAHKPYHESDHIMNICYNVMTGNDAIEDLEKLRIDTAYMNALGAKRIPDPTTAGDFLRRFMKKDVNDLQDVFNERRIAVWRTQDKDFFKHAILQVDATIERTDAECMEGIDISYKGEWGYAPLVVSLAATREPLYIENRSGNTTSETNAPYWLDKAIALVKPYFKKIHLRGDTAYSLTSEFDKWTENDVLFVFGIDAMPNLKGIADGIKDWHVLERPVKYTIETEPRQKPENVKQQIVQERGYKDIVLEGESYAEFDYQPGKCNRSYRVVVVKKDLSIEQHQISMWKEVRYFFYISNDTEMSAQEIVYFSNDRCDHENDIEQLRNGVKAFSLPTNTLESNWAYMVIAGLAWTLKAWMGLIMPCRQTGHEIIRMEFKRYLKEFVEIPAQVLRTGRRIVIRLLQYMSRAPEYFKFLDILKSLRLTS